MAWRTVLGRVSDIQNTGNQNRLKLGWAFCSENQRCDFNSAVRLSRQL